jgi:hypothetical protein
VRFCGLLELASMRIRCDLRLVTPRPRRWGLAQPSAGIGL